MKKILIFLLLLILGLYSGSNAHGYAYFEYYEKVGHGKLLKEYTDEDYGYHYSRIEPQFLGWRAHHVTEDLKIKYTSETLFSYYNNGLSPIQYHYKATKKTIDSYSLKVSGGIKLQTQKNNKVFGDGLSAAINIDYKQEGKYEETENFDIKVSIEPKTKLVLYMYGEGLITNGVAKNYFFWLEINQGGYEIFMVTTYYQRLEVTPI